MPSVWSSLNIRDKISHPHKTTFKIIVLYVFIRWWEIETYLNGELCSVRLPTTQVNDVSWFLDRMVYSVTVRFMDLTHHWLLKWEAAIFIRKSAERWKTIWREMTWQNAAPPLGSAYQPSRVAHVLVITRNDSQQWLAGQMIPSERILTRLTFLSLQWNLQKIPQCYIQVGIGRILLFQLSGYSYGLDCRGSIPSRGKKYFSTPQCREWLWAHPASYPMGTGGSFPGG
jgi:hypothetical protein